MPHALNKLKDVWHAIVPERKLSVKEKSVKATAKNLTTLEVIALAALTMYPHALFHALLTDEGSRKQKPEEKQGTIK